MPGLPAPRIDPDVVLFVFLPPLLYFAGFSSSAYELRHNAAPIGLLAIGLVLGWSSMRGGASLAAALAIPVTAESGARFPGRDLLIFLAYAVVLVTLVLPGLTLSPLIRLLGLGQGEERRRADAAARARVTHAALERLQEIARDEEPSERVVERLRERYQARLDRLESRLEEMDGDGDGARGVDRHEAARLLCRMLDAERAALVDLQRERAYPADVLRELQREIDLDESRVQARTRA